MIINIEYRGCSINPLNRIRLQFEICQAIRQRPEKINLLFATTGGQINEAFLFYDFIKELDYPINIFNIGEIRSAGTVMFLAFDNRFFLQKAKFLFHAVRLNKDVVITTEKQEQNKKFNEKMLSIFDDRINLPPDYISTMKKTLDDIEISDPKEINKFSIATFSDEKFIPTISIPCADNK